MTNFMQVIFKNLYAFMYMYLVVNRSDTALKSKSDIFMYCLKLLL